MVESRWSSFRQSQHVWRQLTQKVLFTRPRQNGQGQTPCTTSTFMLSIAGGHQTHSIINQAGIRLFKAQSSWLKTTFLAVKQVNNGFNRRGRTSDTSTSLVFRIYVTESSTAVWTLVHYNTKQQPHDFKFMFPPKISVVLFFSKDRPW